MWNLKETVNKLKKEKTDLTKSVKKLQNNKKINPFKNNNPPLKEPTDIIATEDLGTKNLELEITEKETDTIAYNIPVDNPFQITANSTIMNGNRTITEDSNANVNTEVDFVDTVENKNDFGDKKEKIDNAFIKAFQECLQTNFPSIYTEEVISGLNNNTM